MSAANFYMKISIINEKVVHDGRKEEITKILYQLKETKQGWKYCQILQIHNTYRKKREMILKIIIE